MTTNRKPKSEEGLVIWNAVCKAIEESKANWKDSTNAHSPISLLNHIRYQMELAMGNFILLQDAQDTEDAKNTFDTNTDPQYTEDPDINKETVLDQVTQFKQDISALTDNLQDLRSRLKDQLDTL